MAAVTLQPYAQDGLEIIRAYQAEHRYNVYATAFQTPMKPFPEAICERLETGCDYSTWSIRELDALVLRHGFSLKFATGIARLSLARTAQQIDLHRYISWKKRMKFEPFFEARPDDR